MPFGETKFIELNIVRNNNATHILSNKITSIAVGSFMIVSSLANQLALDPFESLTRSKQYVKTDLKFNVSRSLLALFQLFPSDGNVGWY